MAHATASGACRHKFSKLSGTEKNNSRKGWIYISQDKINKRRTGAFYEQVAIEYLTIKGYRIVEKNYRNSYGEVDIIAQLDDTELVFFEIKYRASFVQGNPLEAVDKRKQRKISRVALFYYATHGYREEIPCRFDVIGIYGDGTIHHIENAFCFQ